MEKINIAELLRDCPKGMELDCTIWDSEAKVFLKRVLNDDFAYPIEVTVKYNNTECTKSFTKYGAFNDLSYCKCVIFPKGKTTWEGFHRPFVEGDVVSTESGMYIGIVKSTKDDNEYCTFCSVHGKQDFHVGRELLFSRLATKEEKQIMFDIIKANGYHWNAKTKTLEKLPKFKVGDVVRSKNCPEAGSFVIVDVKEDTYSINLKKYCIKFKDQDNYELVSSTKPKFKAGDKIRHKKNNTIIKTIGHIYSDSYALYDGHLLYFNEQNNWELVPNKFDITTLKALQPVLVRNTNGQVWTMDLFSHKIDTNRGLRISFVCVGHCPNQCIPYKGNEHLLGTTNDCDDFYKTWK